MGIHGKKRIMIRMKWKMYLFKMGDAIMAVSYKRLWKLLVDKEMSKSDVRKKAEIAPNTMTKLRRDEEVSNYR